MKVSGHACLCAVNFRDPHGSGIELSCALLSPAEPELFPPLGLRVPSPRMRHFPGLSLFLTLRSLMPTLPLGQTSPCFRTQMSSLGRPASGSFPTRMCTGQCSIWVVVSDLPADLPSFEVTRNLNLQRVCSSVRTSKSQLTSLARFPSW